jgi:hypothetical protein
MTGSAIGCQPEVDFCTGGRIAPMAGQKETLLLFNHTATFANLSIGLFYVATSWLTVKTTV